MNTLQAAKQLERSERGQKAAKLLLDFLDSSTVKFLDRVKRCKSKEAV